MQGWADLGHLVVQQPCYLPVCLCYGRQYHNSQHRSTGSAGDCEVVLAKPDAVSLPRSRSAAGTASGSAPKGEPPEETPEAQACFWWRRGRVELGLKHAATLFFVTNAPHDEASPSCETWSRHESYFISVAPESELAMDREG